MSIFFLGTVGANLVHWHLRGNEKFFYFPTVGPPGVAFKVTAAITLVSAVLSLMRILPPITWMAVFFGWGILLEFYSIWYRQKIRKQDRPLN